MSRVIRVDDEVWDEMERRAQGFGDNPNAVLRRILDLEERYSSATYDVTEGNDMDDRVGKLLDLVTQDLGSRPPNYTTPGSPDRIALRSGGGRAIVVIRLQKQRLRVASKIDLAERLGLNNWEHKVKNGWYGQMDSVIWYVPNEDDEAYRRVGLIIARLLRGDT